MSGALRLGNVVRWCPMEDRLGEACLPSNFTRQGSADPTPPNYANRDASSVQWGALYATSAKLAFQSTTFFSQGATELAPSRASFRSLDPLVDQQLKSLVLCPAVPALSHGADALRAEVPFGLNRRVLNAANVRSILSLPSLNMNPRRSRIRAIRRRDRRAYVPVGPARR